MDKLTRDDVKSVLEAKTGDVCRDKYVVVGDNYGGDLRNIDYADGIPCEGFPHTGFYDASDKVSIFPHHIIDGIDTNIKNFGWEPRRMKFSPKDSRNCHAWMWDIACMLHTAGVKSRVVSVYGTNKGYVEWYVYDPTDDENENSSVRNSIGIDCEDHDGALWVYTTSDDLENLL